VLGQLGFQDSYPFKRESEPILRRLVDRERDPEVLGAALLALGHLGLWDVLLASDRHLTDESKTVRLAFAQALSLPPDPCPAGIVDLMIKLTRDRIGEVRNWACFALGTQTSADSEPIRAALAARLNDRHRECRAEAVLGLARRRDDRAEVHVLRALRDGSIGRLTITAAAYVGSEGLLSDLHKLEGRWDLDSEADSELLGTAVSRCNPIERARHFRSRTVERGRFEKLLRAELAKRSPALELVKVALQEDLEDYFRLSNLEVSWRGAGEPGVTYWHWDALMKRASGRLAKAAQLVSDDLLRLANGAPNGS
jgi:hypothetical protein